MATENKLCLLVDCLICRKRRSQRRPKLLNCKHGFCLECLKKTSSLLSDGKLQCPACWECMGIPHQGIIGLKNDKTVINFEKIVTTSKEANICTGCVLKGDKEPAKMLCSDCKVKLCKTCANAHLKNPEFSGHIINENVCEIHVQVLIHGCLTCHVGFCSECTFSEIHDGHMTCDLAEYDVKLDNFMLEKIRLLEEETAKFGKETEGTKDHSNEDLVKIQHKMEERLDNQFKRLRDSFQKHLDLREESLRQSFTTALKQQTEAVEKASNLVADANNSDADKETETVTKLYQQTKKIFKAVDALRNARRFPVPTPVLEEDKLSTQREPARKQISFSCTVGDVKPGLLNLFATKPSFRISLSKIKDQNLQFVKYLAPGPGGSVFIGEYNSDTAYLINTNGEVLDWFQTAPSGVLRGLDTNNEDLYIASQNIRSWVQKIGENSYSEVSIKQDIDNIADFALHGETLLFVDYKNSLLRYSHKGDLLQCMARGLFTYVSASYNQAAGMVFLLSELGSQQLHLIKPNGALIRSIGCYGKNEGQFIDIQGATMLPNGNILVADFQMHRVSEFTFEGDFVRTLLTKEDGVTFPMRLLVVYPYLWIGCGGGIMIFQFTHPADLPED